MKGTHKVVWGVSILVLIITSFAGWHLPYFWDELGVYGKGVQFMYKNDFSLLPDALPPEISRGHPLLVFAAHALILKLFGNYFTISHLFSLTISVGVLLGAYKLATLYLVKINASLIVLLLVCQNIFLAQSLLILPEMWVALFAVWSFYYLLKRKYLISSLLCVLGVLSKESFILLPALYGLFMLINLIVKKQTRWIYYAFYFTLPLLALLWFLACQKHTFGWYFFPYHTDIIKTDALVSFSNKLNRHYNFVFYKQGRNLWIIFVLAYLLALPFKKHKMQQVFLILIPIFSLLLFSFAFYMDRYILYIYPFLALIVLIGVSHIIKQKKIAFLIGLVLCVWSVVQLAEKRFNYDVSLAYRDVVNAQMETSSYICHKVNSNNFYMDFPISMGFDAEKLGYVSEKCMHKINAYTPYNQAKYIVLFNREIDNEEYHLITSFKKNLNGFYIYEKE